MLQSLQTAPITAHISTAARDQIDDLATLHTIYAPRLFRFLLLSTRDRDLAESLTQDTFLKLWKTRDSFRGDCALYTWITRIAVSLLRSHTRTETFRFWPASRSRRCGRRSSSSPNASAPYSCCAT